MAGTVKQNLGLALRMLLKPLVKLLISQGMTQAEFSEAAKDVYVEMAIRHFSDNKKVNKSKIAVLTGLTRKEVANVLNRAIDARSQAREFSRPSRVLSGWHSDPMYMGPYGIPNEIPYGDPDRAGEGPSFVHLVKTYSGDMAPKSMLEELLRGGAIVQLDGDMLKVLRRDFEPRSLSPELIERFGDVGFNFISTVAANVEKEGTGTGPFDRVVFSDSPLTKKELEDFDLYLKSRGQTFLEEIDNYFSFVLKDRKVPKDTETFETGVAMVQYIEWDPDAKQSLRDLLISIGYTGDSSD
jgi:hypothetical protein